MKRRSYSYLYRTRYRYPHLSSWWKAILILSSSSLTPTLPSHLRPISFFGPIVAKAAFYSSPSKFDFGKRISHGTLLFPATSMVEIGGYSLPNGARPRRSTRNSNRSCDATIQQKGVRLFQDRSDDIENENERGNSDDVSNLVPTDISNDDDGSDVPVTTSKKRRVTRNSSKKISESDGTETTLSVSTPIRGSNAIPVTPEPVVVENNSSSARSPRKKTKATTKTTEVKRKRKAKTARTSTKTASKTKKKSPRAVVSWPAPDGWRETYELVRELRKDKTAPCDFMGAEALSSPQKVGDNNDDAYADMDHEESAKVSRFHTLIALMLSSQTKDAMVGQAMGNLHDTSDGSGGLTVASILEMDPKVLNSKIYSVGFRNNKTKYIKQAAQILHDEYNGDIPPTAGEMIRDLPGVGPKMAYIVENICWDRQSGIGVDTHMQRLFPKLGWVSPDTKNPEQSRKQLESWLPQEYWGEINLLWVGFGQEVQQERQKVLRKALLCDHPSEALSLLRAVDFDVSREWNKMELVDTLASDEDEMDGIPWKNDSEKEKMNNLIEEVMSRK